MVKHFYSKKLKNSSRKCLRILSVLFIVTGLTSIIYFFLPIVLWYIYFQPFETQDIINPTPKINTTTNLESHFPKSQSEISKYFLSIPRVNIENAVVSTVDTNTTKHLVNYGKYNIPGKTGNSLIFGHSTLPQFFNNKNYKTIFTNIHKLKNGDKIYATVGNSVYLYKVFQSRVIDASDTSLLEQNYNNSYITLVTCTPPGTIWKRLIVKARFEKII
ncbi:MAG: sortase [Candidatus Levybacteria bacterium]|nr:sortase [Candidatus Levybacteria bacterium]